MTRRILRNPRVEARLLRESARQQRVRDELEAQAMARYLRTSNRIWMTTTVACLLLGAVAVALGWPKG